MKKTANQSQVKVLFNEHRHAIILMGGYVCAIAAAFMPLFIK